MKGFPCFVFMRLGISLLIVANGFAQKAQPAKERILLPGLEANGGVRLPNSWSIKPAGRQIELGDFPINIALHASGKWAAILHAGYGNHEIIIVSLKEKKERVRSRVVIDQSFAGLTFSPDGKSLFVGGGESEVVYHFPFEDGYLTRPTKLKVADEKFIPGSLSIHPDGKTLFVPGVWGHAVCLLPVRNAKDRVLVSLGKDSYPFACLADSKGKRLYVSLWNRSAVAVVDLAAKKVVETWPTEKHPTEMVLGPGDKTLFVACSNSTRVSVINVANGKGLETINCALYANAPSGNTPNSLSLTSDGQILFVANADASNLAVFNVAEPGKAKPLGFIPVGMYPTSVRYHAANKQIYVVNGRGTAVKANPHGPNPLAPRRLPRCASILPGFIAAA